MEYDRPRLFHEKVLILSKLRQSSHKTNGCRLHCSCQDCEAGDLTTREIGSQGWPAPMFHVGPRYVFRRKDANDIFLIFHFRRRTKNPVDDKWNSREFEERIHAGTLAALIESSSMNTYGHDESRRWNRDLTRDRARGGTDDKTKRSWLRSRTRQCESTVPNWQARVDPF